MQELIGALSLASIYVLFALGMSLTWGTIDILNFAHGSIFMFSAFTAYLVLQSTSLSFLVVLLIGVVGRRGHVPADPGVGVRADHQTGQGQTVRRDADPHRRHRRRDHSRCRSRSTTPRATRSGFENSSFQVTKITFGDYWVTNVQLITIVLAAVLGIATAWWLRRSRQGLALRAIGVDSEVASIMGVDRRRLALVTMAVAGAMAGLAGILLTYSLGAITPESGDTLLVKAFACIILGGVGSMAGVYAGVVPPRGRRDRGPHARPTGSGSTRCRSA